MRVAAVQFKATKKDPAASLARLVPLAREAAQGADLVVLPEMAATGYVFASPDEIRPLAEPPDGPTFRALSAVAREARAWLVCGYVEREIDRLFNSALVVDCEGALRFSYRKTLLFDADTSWAEPGDSGYRTFDTGAGTFGVGICMDLNDDRFTDWVRAEKPRCVAFPTNWLDQGDNVWGYWAWRMRGTKSALVAANSYGPDGDVSFRGESAVLDGRTLLAHAGRDGDAVLRATLLNDGSI
jgi:N-carbamoylputrescine amidase